MLEDETPRDIYLCYDLLVRQEVRISLSKKEFLEKHRLEMGWPIYSNMKSCGGVNIGSERYDK